MFNSNEDLPSHDQKDTLYYLRAVLYHFSEKPCFMQRVKAIMILWF